MGVERRVLGLVAAVVLVGGCGGGGHSSHGSSNKPARSIEVKMKDIAFEPATVTVTAGETVKFVFFNEGQIRHDAFIGDEAAQAEHEKEMREAGSDGKDHDGGGHGITVEPGDIGSLTHTFKAGDVLVIGCHEAGHYAAGMKVAVTVS